MYTRGPLQMLFMRLWANAICCGQQIATHETLFCGQK